MTSRKSYLTCTLHIRVFPILPVLITQDFLSGKANLPLFVIKAS